MPDKLSELDSTATFDPSRDAEFFATLPELPAVVLIEPRPELPQARPYLIRTANLRRRLERLLADAPRPEVTAGARKQETGASARASRLSLRKFAYGIRYRVAGSIFELAWLHWHQARRLDPGGYRQKLRLRWPALIKMNLANPYPRCYVTRRVTSGEAASHPAGSFYFGPFASRRASEHFSSEFLNLFKIRRCQIKIRRDPSFPGCMYSEMKMCLAPCFAGCSDEDYAQECARVRDFLTTSGASLLGEWEAQREAASAALDFERASEWHRRLDRAREVLRGLPEIARRIDQLHAMILQRAAEPEAIAIFLVRGGTLAEPFLLRFGQSAEPRSAEETLRAKFDAAPQVAHQEAGPGSPQEADEILGDHLALLARWFYSKPRAGEIFFREKDWPYRRLIRACRRLLQDGPTQP